MSPRLIAAAAALVLAVLLAGCGGGDWPDEADAAATKPEAPRCDVQGMCT